MTSRKQTVWVGSITNTQKVKQTRNLTSQVYKQLDKDSKIFCQYTGHSKDIFCCRGGHLRDSQVQGTYYTELQFSERGTGLISEDDFSSPFECGTSKTRQASRLCQHALCERCHIHFGKNSRAQVLQRSCQEVLYKWFLFYSLINLTRLQLFSVMHLVMSI